MKKLTLDDIAIMINKGFQNTQDFIIKELGCRIDKVETKLNNVETGLKSKIDKLDDKIISLEQKVNRALYINNVNLDSRVTVLEKKILRRK